MQSSVVIAAIFAQADEDWQYAVVRREGGVELLRPGQRSTLRTQQNSSLLDNIEVHIPANLACGGSQGVHQS